MNNRKTNDKCGTFTAFVGQALFLVFREVIDLTTDGWEKSTALVIKKNMSWSQIDLGSKSDSTIYLLQII